MQEINNLFIAGGVVMWPLFGFSILAIALILERCVFWFRINRRQQGVISGVISLYRQNNVAEALNRLQQNVDLPMARIFLAALELEDPTPEQFRLALEGEMEAELPLLKRFNTIFETIVSLSPLLGLLGTILGLIRSFASLNIGQVGGSQTVGVTAGISEALVATASGLVVALVTLVFANTFRGFYQRQIGLIQEYGARLELLYSRQYEKGEKSYASTP